MASKFWIKVYTEMLNDPKIMRLPEFMRWRFIALLLLAGENDKAGLLPPVSDIAWHLRLDEPQVEETLSALSLVGVVATQPDGWLVVNFSKRQAPSDATTRMREYRERKEDVTKRNGDVTKRNENVTKRHLHSYARYTPERDTDTEKNREEGEGDTEGESERAAAPPAPPPDSEPSLALAAWTELVGKPRRNSCEAIVDGLGVSPDIERLRAVARAWSNRGYSPNNVDGILEWYREGIPETGKSFAARREASDAWSGSRLVE